MVGISTMIGGFVPELFWSLVPNEAVNDNLPSKNFESLINFYLDMKEKELKSLLLLSTFQDGMQTLSISQNR